MRGHAQYSRWDEVYGQIWQHGRRNSKESQASRCNRTLRGAQKRQEGPEEGGQLAFAGVCIHLCRDNTSDGGGSNLKKEGLATVASPFPRTRCEEGGYPHSFIEAIAFLASTPLPPLPLFSLPRLNLCIS